MKKLIILSLVIFTSINHAFAAVTSGTSNVKIVPVMTIVAGTTPLEFGSIAAGATAGTIVLTAASPTVSSTTGGVTALAVGGATRTAGSFTVTGEPGANYVLSTLPSVTLTSGTNTMTATLTSSSGRALAGGTNTLLIGGTLSVAANQTPGFYTGTYNVTVNY
jgi:hypothetical protein